jgi:hypothetical protein
VKIGALPAIPTHATATLPALMSASKLPIDPKELVPAAIGLAIGVGILVFFALLASGLGLTLFVDHSTIPQQ